MKTTVLTLGLYAGSGGPARSVRAFAGSLNASVISWVDPDRYSRESLVWEDSTVVRGSQLPVLRQLLVPQSCDLPAAERLVASSDLVSCHSFWRWHNIWLLNVVRRNGVPYWFVPHGILDPYVFTYDRAAKWSFLAMGGRRFLDEAAGVVCATRQEYHKIAPWFRDKPHAIIPWPLDEGDFRLRDEALRAVTRARLGIASDATVFLSLGRLDPMKRPLETIDALARCRDHHCHLIIVGNESGIGVDECHRRAVRCGVEDRVHVIGPVYGDGKHAYMDASDAYVSLSHRENFNFAAVEAMASGLPVILSPGNDLVHELMDVPCGWMLRQEEDVGAVFDRVAAVGNSERDDFGRRARDWARVHLRRESFDRAVRDFASEVAR